LNVRRVQVRFKIRSALIPPFRPRAPNFARRKQPAQHGCAEKKTVIARKSVHQLLEFGAFIPVNWRLS